MSLPRNGRTRPLFGKIQLTSIDYLHQRGVSVFDRALLLMLIGLAKYNGIVYHSQREIADYAGTYQGNVSDAIKRLVDLGILLKEGGILRIDPVFCKFGNRKDRDS